MHLDHRRRHRALSGHVRGPRLLAAERAAHPAAELRAERDVGGGQQRAVSAGGGEGGGGQQRAVSAGGGGRGEGDNNVLSAGGGEGGSNVLHLLYRALRQTAPLRLTPPPPPLPLPFSMPQTARFLLKALVAVRSGRQPPPTGSVAYLSDVARELQPGRRSSATCEACWGDEQVCVRGGGQEQRNVRHAGEMSRCVCEGGGEGAPGLLQKSQSPPLCRRSWRRLCAT